MLPPRRLDVVVLAAALTVSSAASAEGKVGVVDIQRSVMETEDGARAQATLKKVFDKKQQDLDARQTELQRAREDIEKQSRILSKEALSRRMEDWQRRMVELQTVFVEYNKELQKKQGELTGPILQKMIGLLRRLATQRGFDVIVDRQAAPYARGDLDVTDQLVQMYNRGEAGDAPADKPGEAPKTAAPAPLAPAAPAATP